MQGLLDCCLQNMVIGTTVFVKRKAEEYIKSIEKFPKYYIVEEEVKLLPNEEGVPNCFEVVEPKLITLTDGTITGVIKELIWE